MHRVALVVALTGCFGSVETGPLGPLDPDDSELGPDAGVGSGSLPCKPTVTSGIRSGEHNAGQDCMGGCHDHGFTLAGTLYATATGGTPMVGATITVTDAATTTFELVSMQNGNFYTTQPMTFPVTVFASQCPDTKPMVSAVTANGSGCNQAACHAAGSTTGRIYLR